MEKLKRNNDMVILEKYFPGESCGNAECEKQGIKFCKILEKNIFLQKEDISRIAAKQMIFPSICPALEVTSHPYLCRFHIALKNQAEIFWNKAAFSDIGQIRYMFHGASNGCKKCAELRGTVVTENELRNNNAMQSKGFYKIDGVYRPHPNCKCYWKIQKEVLNKPSKRQRILNKIMNVYQALEYAVIETVGSQAFGIGTDVVKIGTMIVTDIRFFAARTRTIISDYENEEKIDCSDDIILLGELYHKNDWKEIAKLHNKYITLLKKSKK